MVWVYCRLPRLPPHRIIHFPKGLGLVGHIDGLMDALACHGIVLLLNWVGFFKNVLMLDNDLYGYIINATSNVLYAITV